jgi:surfeit locus 1 family protein
MLSRRTKGFLVFATAIVAGCVRLGFWQLERLDERRRANSELLNQQASAPAPLSEFSTGDASYRYRASQVSGRYDYEHELVLTSRARDGSPGVYVLTPLTPSDGSPTVLINRGWAYSPDGMTLDLSRFREGDSATVHGYVELFSSTTGPVSTPTAPKGVRHLDLDSISARVGEKLAPVLLVSTVAVPSGKENEIPVRLARPSLSEGSHRGYAFQWFAFAVIGVIGMTAVVAREHGRVQA